MGKRFLFLTVLLTLLTSCVSSSDIGATGADSTTSTPAATIGSYATLPLPTRQSTTAPVTDGFILTPSLLPTDIPRITETMPPRPTSILTPTPTPEVIFNPRVEQRCPDPLEVPLSELGLDDRSRPIIAPFNKDNLGSWSLMDEELNTQLIFEDFSESEKEANFWISPNKQWMALRIRDDPSTYSLWLVSIDGRERKRLLNGIAYTTVFKWTDNQTLVAIDDDLSRPTMLIHPFMSPSIEDLEPVILDLRFYTFAFSPDASKLIYFQPSFDPPSQWILHDYVAGESRIVLPRMDVSRIEIPTDVWLNWKSENISLALVSENSLELMLNVPPERLPHQTFPMYEVIFPDTSYWTFVDWWSMDSRFIAFSRYFTFDQLGPSKFYLLDTQRWLLYDYCIDAGRVYAASDERFFAWTDYDTQTTGRTVVMDVLTGKRSRLEGVKVLGWGELP